MLNKESPPYHFSALKYQAVDALNIRPSGVYVDATFGGGGHSKEMLRRLPHYEGIKQIYAFDKDKDVMEHLIIDERWQFVFSDFRYIRPYLNYYGIDKVDGILADLGVSFHHFDTPKRGFSIRDDGPLDMRMNQKGGMTAADVVMRYSEEDLTRIFSSYADVKEASYYASSVVAYRSDRPIDSTFHLIAAFSHNRYNHSEIKEKMHSFSPHFKNDLIRLFQSLRIEVNGELEALQCLLEASLTLLKPKGRLVILSYHSGEDRMVKRFMRSGKLNGEVEKDLFGNELSPLRPIKTPTFPSSEEIEKNPRCRSVRLRVAEKV